MGLCGAGGKKAKEAAAERARLQAKIAELEKELQDLRRKTEQDARNSSESARSMDTLRQELANLKDAKESAENKMRNALAHADELQRDLDSEKRILTQQESRFTQWYAQVRDQVSVLTGFTNILLIELYDGDTNRFMSEGLILVAPQQTLQLSRQAVVSRPDVTAKGANGQLGMHEWAFS